jgi:acetyl esterase/lipase
MPALAYGPDPDQVADLVLPPKSGAPAPLVLFWHGGFWRVEYDRHHARPFVEALAAHGCAVANVEYRRVGGGGGWPTTFTDVALAADTLPGLAAAAYPGRIDPERVVYVGHSAGGHLAVWAALRDRIPSGAPGAASRLPGLVGVVGLAPVVDLAGTYATYAHARRPGGSVGDLLGGGPHEHPDRYAAADPSALGAPSVPLVIGHGDQDTAVPITDSQAYTSEHGGKLLSFDGIGHHALIDPRSPVWPHIRDAITDLGGAAPNSAAAQSQ